MAYSINHVHIRSSDPRASASWYEKHFDAKVLWAREVMPGTVTVSMEVGGPVRLNISSQPDGGSAYAKAVSERPDIVLLDINMPVMSGFLVLHDLKHNPETESIPVIILTSSHLPRDETEGMRKGALDFIIKPWGPGELEDRIRMAIAYLESRTPGRTSPVAGNSPSPGDFGNKPKLTPGAALPGQGLANSNPRRSSIQRPGRARGPERGAASNATPAGRQIGERESRYLRQDLEDAARAFILEKYQRVRQVTLTRIRAVGPISGLNVYEVEGVTTVLLGDVPGLQAKGFHLTVRITHDGRVMDKRGRVL